MKHSNLSKIVGSGVLIASLSLLPLVPASAQQSGNTTDSTQASPGDTAVYDNGVTDQGERTFDWGWVGLLGLIGLAGRLAKKRTEERHYSEPDQMNRVVTTEETTRYRDSSLTSRAVTSEDARRYRDPNEVNPSVTTEETTRYRDPDERNHSGNTNIGKR